MSNSVDRKGWASVVRGNKLDQVPEDAVDYEFADNQSFLGSHGNLMPMPGATQAPRLFYGDRFFNQFVPLKDREAPLVRNKDTETGRSFDRIMGERAGTLVSDVDGEVEKVGRKELVVKTKDGKKRAFELYEDFPYNRFTFITHTASVKRGDPVEAGQILATSNYTDKEGRLAPGRNARIALVAHEGYGMDDAAEISSSFAEKLRSEHISRVEHENDPDIKIGKNHFVALFPKAYTKEQLEKIGDDGVVKPGVVLEPGDPVFLKTRPRSYSSASAGSSGISKSKRFVRRDASEIWDGHDPAEVVDVARHGKGVKAFLKYSSPARPGDKVVLRAGQKSTISRVIPDEKMPRTEDGEPLDMLLNQLSLPSRVNAQIYHELMLGKIARRTGKPYVLPPFLEKGKTWVGFVEDELNRAGVPDAEKIYDPEKDVFLQKPVAVGVGHVMKLQHMAAKKLSSRGQSGYDINRQPMKGGTDAGRAQRFSGLETHVALSGGAYNLLREKTTLSGELNDEYFRALRTNRSVKKAGRPFVWDKFLAMMNGTGINTKDRGAGKIRLTPMTDRELERRKSVPMRKGDIVDLRTMEPIPGGLFDPDLVRGNKWGHVDLPFEMVNPAYDEVARTLLGLKKSEYEELAAS